MSTALTVKKRDLKTQTKASQLRKQGWIPATLFSRGKETEHLILPEKGILKILQKGEHVLQLDVQGASRQAVIQDYHTDPVDRVLLNVSLQEVKRGEKTVVSVPLICDGIAVGTKEGGVLIHSLHEIDIRCAPENIPNAIHVDVSGLGVHDSIHVRDLKAPHGVEFLADMLDREVAVVHIPRQEKEPEPVAAVAAEAADVAGDASPAAEGDQESA